MPGWRPSGRPAERSGLPSSVRALSRARNPASLAGIAARSVHELTIDRPVTAGVDTGYCAGKPGTATAVRSYGEGGSGEEIRLELLAQPGPRPGSCGWPGLARLQ